MIYDEIKIDGLKCFAHHGVNPEETEKGQDFYVNAVLYCDTHKAGLSDDLRQTTNYSHVAKFIHSFMKEHTYKLIEAVAEELAGRLLHKFSLVERLDLEICKPDAPIGLEFSSVSVKISRGWRQAYIGVGSNLGNRHKYIEEASRKIAAHPMIREFKISEIVNSTPCGATGQPDFLNCVIGFRTLLSAPELLQALQGLEKAMGRERSEENVRGEARTLDLDILLYEDTVMADEHLTLPHPEMHKRDFVLAPLISLNPQLMHPVFNRTMIELYDDLTEWYIIK
jgi:dihydroneopterin aldolase/2-amino-4-hydroxy-6-hydroxymethyldihydropteridine diphosphokinase